MSQELQNILGTRMGHNDRVAALTTWAEYIGEKREGSILSNSPAAKPRISETGQTVSVLKHLSLEIANIDLVNTWQLYKKIADIKQKTIIRQSVEISELREAEDQLRKKNYQLFVLVVFLIILILCYAAYNVWAVSSSAEASQSQRDIRMTAPRF